VELCQKRGVVGQYSAVHCFWPVEFPNVRLGASHLRNDSVVFGLVLPSASVSTVDLTLKFQANKHPPLAISPHPVGPSASTANSTTGQKLCTALYERTGRTLALGLCIQVEAALGARGA